MQLGVRDVPVDLLRGESLLPNLLDLADPGLSRGAVGAGDADDVSGVDPRDVLQDGRFLHSVEVTDEDGGAGQPQVTRPGVR